MDKIRLDFFDVLGYLIPGTALLLSLWVTADPSVEHMADLYDQYRVGLGGGCLCIWFYAAFIGFFHF